MILFPVSLDGFHKTENDSQAFKVLDSFTLTVLSCCSVCLIKKKQNAEMTEAKLSIIN